MHLRPLVRAGDEVLAPVLGELHRPQQLPGRPRHQHLLRPRVLDLHAEAAADVRGDHVDVGQRQVELGRDGGAHAGGGLGRGPQAHAAGLRSQRASTPRPSIGVERTARCAGRAPARAARRRWPRRYRRALAPSSPRRCRARRDARGARLSGRVDADHGGQRLVADGDQLGGILGDVAIGGDDHHHGLADVVDLVLRQRVRRPAAGQRRVRDQQRQRPRQPARQILVGVDRDQAVHVQRRAHVDVDDPGVRVRAAHERRRQASASRSSR